MSQIKLIVGLGNPGQQYVSTRHNAGFWFIDRLAEQLHSSLMRKDKFFGYVGTATIEGKSVYLLKPETFMNLSGKSVLALSSFYRIEANQILVAHDELDIGCGDVRFKATGGHGGHNGLKDIIRCLGTKDFYRLRIGIDHPGHASQVTNFVLSQPAKSDKQLIQSSIELSVEQMPAIVNGDFEAVMQALHTRRDVK